MSVRVIRKESGEVVQGKFASIKGGEVNLFSGIMADKRGGFRGCGKKLGVFPLVEVALESDEPGEVKEA